MSGPAERMPALGTPLVLRVSPELLDRDLQLYGQLAGVSVQSRSVNITFQENVSNAYPSVAKLSTRCISITILTDRGC
jgi:hypothetical protein